MHEIKQSGKQAAFFYADMEKILKKMIKNMSIKKENVLKINEH